MQHRNSSYPPITTVSPVYRALVAFPIATFSLTVLSDIAYLQTSNLLWLHFSEWLLLAGLVFGVAAALFLAGVSVVRRIRPAWLYALGGVVVLLLAAFNSFIHTADGWTAVMPYGLATSIATVIAMIVTGLFGRGGMTMSKQFAHHAPSLALAAALLAGCSEGDNFDVSRQIGPDPLLPEPSSTLIPDLKVAEVVGWSDGQTPAVPEGLSIAAYATGLANPRTVHTLPNGDVLVVQSKAPPGKPLNRPKDIIRGFIMSMAAGSADGAKETNLVTLLQDTNRDGTVDQRSDLLTGLMSPFGVAWHDNTLYVAAADAILAYSYELGQTKISATPRVLTPLPGGPINHHWTKDLALSPDGRFLYASVGSNSNAGERGMEAEKGRAAIWQVDRQTGAARVFASGLRNPNGLNLHPETGELWTVVNERDELGPNLVPDYMTSVREGGFYGWPWSYYGQHVDERVHPPRPDLVDKAIAPDYALASHVAALGLAFTNGSAMPEAYRNGAFVGNRGSWNRNAYNGYKIIYVPFTNGKPSGSAQDVVTGFLEGDEARGRPVGLGIDGTGALLIADDAGNTVWRVSSADGALTSEPLPTDRVTAAAAPPGSVAQPVQAAPADDPETPSQTDIAPAVSPEDGIPAPAAQ